MTSLDDWSEQVCDEGGDCYTYAVVWTFEADGDLISKTDVLNSVDGENYTYSSSHKWDWEFTSATEDNILIIDEKGDKFNLKINSISSNKLSGELTDDDYSYAIEFERL